MEEKPDKEIDNEQGEAVNQERNPRRRRRGRGSARMETGRFRQF